MAIQPPLDALHRAVDVEHLEQQLEPGAAHVDHGLEGRGRQRPAGRRERVEHRGGLLLARHRRGGEVAPDVAVLGPGQQQHVGALGGAAGAADLLVVGDGRRRRAEVHDEPEVGLVEAHAERAGRDQRLDLVVAAARPRPRSRSAGSVRPV